MCYRILILGSGFIGSSLVSKFLKQGHIVSVIDRGHKPLNLPKEVTWHSKDLSSIDDFSEYLIGIDIVYHLFSSSVPADSSSHLLYGLNNDLQLTLKILDSTVSSKVGRFVFASSSSVYGIQQLCPISEHSDCWPISSHGVQKLTIERYLWLYKHLYGLDVRIARISNPYGPGQSSDGRQGIIAILIGSLINSKSFNLSCSLDVIRDFIYIDDLIQGLYLYGISDTAPSVLNLGSGIGTSISSLVDSLESVAQTKVIIKNVGFRSVDIPVSVLDVSLALSSLSFHPAISLTEGLSLTYSSSMNSDPLV